MKHEASRAAGTNVLSELMRPRPDVRVVASFAGRVLITAITRAEIMRGIELLRPGRRKEALAEAAGQMFSEDFGPALPAVQRAGGLASPG